MSKQFLTRWLPEPQDHDYPAAASFLSLFLDENAANSKVAQLQTAPITQFKAKDILRASGLSVLSFDNAHVTEDHRKIVEGEDLSPILLVRDAPNSKVIIADGYHRLCAVYVMDEDADIPCKIA